MLLHELSRLADHFIDESLSAFDVAVSSQQSEVRSPGAVFGITLRQTPEKRAFRNAGRHEYFDGVFDLAVAAYYQRIFATDVS